MSTRHLNAVQDRLQGALNAVEQECDTNCSLSVKEARRHMLTAQMWLQREIVHQEADTARNSNGEA